MKSLLKKLGALLILGGLHLTTQAQDPWASQLPRGAFPNPLPADPTGNGPWRPPGGAGQDYPGQGGGPWGNNPGPVTPPACDYAMDAGMDLVCGDAYIDLRRDPSQPPLVTYILVRPWFRYALCSGIWGACIDGIKCICVVPGWWELPPAVYTYHYDWNIGRQQCLLADGTLAVTPLTGLSSEPDCMGGSSGWICACAPMNQLDSCYSPCGGETSEGCGDDPPYYGPHGYCQQTIYAYSQNWCVHKHIGTVYRTFHFLFNCKTNNQTIMINVGDLLKQKDPTAEVCQQGERLFFQTQNPGMYGGYSYGYAELEGNWLILYFDQNGPPPFSLPPNPYDTVSLASAVQSGGDVASSLMGDGSSGGGSSAASGAAAALGMGAAGSTPLTTIRPPGTPGGGVLAIPLPSKIVENCYILYLGYKLAGPPCGNDHGGGNGNPPGNPPDNPNNWDYFRADCSSCTPGSYNVWAAWNVSTNYGGLQFLSPDAEISSSLPTGLVGNNGLLTLTNIYTEQAQLSLVLYGTNVTDGSVLWRTVTVTPVLNDSIQVTNLASQVTTLSNGWVSVDFTFTATSREGLPAIYNWIIEQGGNHVFGTGTTATNQGQLSFLTDQAGDTTLTISAVCGGGASFTVRVTGPSDPFIDLYSFYPDPASLRLLNADQSPSTVMYRLRNPQPTQTVNYTFNDLEAGTTLASGSFTGDDFDITNNLRHTSVTAWISPDSGIRSAGVTREARIYVETPLLSLPPVCYNSYSMAVTNLTQAAKAFWSQMFRLDSTEGFDGLASFFYPDNGVLQFDLDGNNVMPANTLSYWTNLLSNESIPNNWYQCGNMSDPVVLPAGYSAAGTRFDVGPLAVNLSAQGTLAQLQTGTITTNAHLELEQMINGAWILQQTIPDQQGTFRGINLGYDTRIWGKKDRYNPALYPLAAQPYLEVENKACEGVVEIRVNPAVTNVSISGVISTNIAVQGPPGTNGLVALNLRLSDGDYVITAAGLSGSVSATNTVSGSYTFSLQLLPGTVDAVLQELPGTNGIPAYLLDSSGDSPVLQLVSSNPGMQFATPAGSPSVERLNDTSVRIHTEGYTTSTEAAVNLLVQSSGCPPIQIDVGLIIRRGGPGFDIPVSNPESGNCLTNVSGGGFPP